MFDTTNRCPYQGSLIRLLTRRALTLSAFTSFGQVSTHVDALDIVCVINRSFSDRDKIMLLNRVEIVLLLAILTFVVGFEVQENIISARSSFQMEQQETTDGLIRARRATSTGN